MSVATATRPRSQAAARSLPQPKSADDWRDRAYPLSRFFLRPLAAWAAWWLEPTRVRPEQVTIVGALAALAATMVLAGGLAATSVAAALVLLAWFCDRLDGELARRQRTTSSWGAWLDANLDELSDIAVHTAIAWAAARQLQSDLPWLLLLAFVAGKYLFMYGLTMEPTRPAIEQSPGAASKHSTRSRLAALYHLPANADVRAHVLVLALAWNALVFELAWVAIYYNLRWTARYALVARRLRGAT